MSDHAKILDVEVVHLPGRKFPGAVIQGDSLSIWLTHVHAARDAATGGDLNELCEELASLESKIRGCLDHYEKTLAKNGFGLPYVR